MEENKEEKKVTTGSTAKKKEVAENKGVKKTSQEGKTESKKVSTTKKKTETSSKTEKKEDPNTFKKVDMKNKNMDNVKEEKKSHKVINFIGIIILILIALYCIFFCRNLIILNNLKTLANQYKDVTNYSYETNNMTFRIKDNVLRVELENEQNPDNNIIIWQNRNTNEQILAFPGQNTATRSSETMMEVSCRLPFTLLDLGDVVEGFALYSLIYTDTVNDKECYVIQVAPDLKMWIEKDTGLLCKQESGDGYYSEVTNVQINTVDEIYMPDLTGYQITTNENVEA